MEMRSQKTGYGEHFREKKAIECHEVIVSKSSNQLKPSRIIFRIHIDCIFDIESVPVRGHGTIKRLILLPFVQRHLKLGDGEKH